jgi:hypothetical protein
MTAPWASRDLPYDALPADFCRPRHRPRIGLRADGDDEDHSRGVGRKAGVACEVSMEKRMACGIGVCLGCTFASQLDGKRL